MKEKEKRENGRERERERKGEREREKGREKERKRGVYMYSMKSPFINNHAADNRGHSLCLNSTIEQ